MNTSRQIRSGMMLGRFELLMPIAAGGMAEVWAARRRDARGSGETVAVKTMLPEIADDAMHRRMFIEEAALAARIRHPNVCEILEHGEQDGALYIAMEWVEGETLAALLKSLNGPMPLSLSLRVALQTAAGLHAAHELRDETGRPLLLAHRDVSPQNILCADDGAVKLVDFGVAKSVKGAHTMNGAIKGKVSYMSPEQIERRAVDRRTDIFALGIVLYRMITGRHPFAGKDFAAIMDNIRSQPMPSPREQDPNFPLEVEEILARCLRKNPKERYQTMAELGQAIEHVLLGMGGARDDLGAFVQSVMSGDGRARRVALRRAVRCSDERYAFDAADTLVMPPSKELRARLDSALTLPSSSREALAGPCWIHREVALPSTLSSTPSSHSVSGMASTQRASSSQGGRRQRLFFAALCVVTALLGVDAFVHPGASLALHGQGLSSRITGSSSGRAP